MSDCVTTDAANLSILRVMANIAQNEPVNRQSLIRQALCATENSGCTLISQDDVLQALCSIALDELKSIKKRQSDGIAAAKAKGVRFGRPVKELPENFTNLVKQWEQGKLRTKDFMMQTGLTESTLYRRLRERNAVKLPQ